MLTNVLKTDYTKEEARELVRKYIDKDADGVLTVKEFLESLEERKRIIEEKVCLPAPLHYKRET